MSSQEKIQIQMTLLKELAARDMPFTHPNDKTMFLRDFYQRCGVSKLYHQLVADFFHNNIQRGSCPKWARTDPRIRDMFTRVRGVYGACLQSTRQRRQKIDGPTSREVEDFAKLVLMQSQVEQKPSLLDMSLPPSSIQSVKFVGEGDSRDELEDPEDEAETSRFSLDILEKMCLKIQNEPVGSPTSSPEKNVHTEEKLASPKSPHPDDTAPLNIQPPLTSVTKTDFEKLNRKMSEVIRMQKKMAIDQEVQNKNINELKQLVVGLMSILATASKVDMQSIATIMTGQTNPDSHGSPDSLPFDHVNAPVDSTNDSPTDCFEKRPFEIDALAVMKQLLNPQVNM